MAHPQSNGETEVTNRTILQGLKIRLDKAKGLWVEKLDHVLWSYRTTPRASTRETPFKLTYGIEAVIPLEIGLASDRIKGYREESNSKIRRADLDLAEEAREKAHMRVATYKKRVARYYNSRVKTKIFRQGDLVLR